MCRIFEKPYWKTFRILIRNAVLNLSKVDFMDSSGLSIIITLLKRVKERGGELVLGIPTKAGTEDFGDIQAG
jgi:anti-anti-sigma factor